MNLFLCSRFCIVGTLIKENLQNKRIAFIPTAAAKEGAWSVRRWGCAFFSCQQFYGFGKTLSEKLHDKINGCAAFALAVSVPFVSPDSQAIVPFPTIFLSGAGKLLAL